MNVWLRALILCGLIGAWWYCRRYVSTDTQTLVLSVIGTGATVMSLFLPEKLRDRRRARVSIQTGNVVDSTIVGSSAGSPTDTHVEIATGDVKSSRVAGVIERTSDAD